MHTRKHACTQTCIRMHNTSHKHSVSHLWQPRPRIDDRLGVLPPDRVACLRLERPLQVKVGRVGGGLGSRV
jgi:hypothetical protein